MPRAPRCEFPGAIHLVSLTGYSGGQVFYDPGVLSSFPDNPRVHTPQANQFEAILWQTCDQYNALVHAYRLDSNAAFTVLQTLGAPLGWIVHDVLARYSMHLIQRHRVPKGQKPFPLRYKAQLVQPAKLPYAVRYVQRITYASDGRRRAINHPFSSHLIYCGRKPRPQTFVTSPTLKALANIGYFGTTAYFDFMARSDSPVIADMLSRRVVGEQHFARFVREQTCKRQQTLSADDILLAVTETVLHTEANVACSSSHLGALARALVAWYAMRTGAARIASVARWFGVSSSDLRYLIHRHREINPQYFSKPLPELFQSTAFAENTPLSTVKGHPNATHALARV